MSNINFKIDREFKTHMHRLKADEEAHLEANLLRDGCRDALVVWAEEGLLLDGHNRYRLCQKHSIPFEIRTVSLPDRQAALIWILQTQLGRRNCTLFEKAELALKLKSLIAAKAKMNQHIGGGRRRKLSSGKLDPSIKRIDTRKELARKAGVSSGTIGKAEYITKVGNEAIKRQLRNGETSIDHEYHKLRKMQNKSQRRKLKQTSVGISDNDRMRLRTCNISNAKHGSMPGLPPGWSRQTV